MERTTSTKTIRAVDLKSGVLYGAVLAATVTLVFGVYWWLLGWIRGGQSPLIDWTLGSFSTYSFQVLLSVLWAMVVNGIGGAVAGLVVVLLYNTVANVMGGLKLTVE
jgi:hypothetical protein